MQFRKITLSLTEDELRLAKRLLAQHNAEYGGHTRLENWLSGVASAAVSRRLGELAAESPERAEAPVLDVADRLAGQWEATQ